MYVCMCQLELNPPEVAIQDDLIPAGGGGIMSLPTWLTNMDLHCYSPEIKPVVLSLLGELTPISTMILSSKIIKLTI